MTHDLHEGDIYFYNEEGQLMANYDSYFGLVDVHMMLSEQEIEYINHTLEENL